MARAASKPTTQVNSYDEELAKFAQEAASLEAGSSNFISTRNGVFSVGGNEVGTEMEVVIMNFTRENHFYRTRFDPENPSSPVCFAFGQTEEEMRPHANSTEPQHEDCAHCPLNVFGSADMGRGKACGNIRRLALITADDLEGDVNAAEIAVLKVPVTSTKAFSNYVSTLSATLRKPPFAVVTNITITKDPKTQFKLSFKTTAEITDGETLKAIMARRPQIQNDLERPYSPAEEQPEAKPRPKGTGAAKGRKY